MPCIRRRGRNGYAVVPRAGRPLAPGRRPDLVRQVEAIASSPAGRRAQYAHRKRLLHLGENLGDFLMADPFSLERAASKVGAVHTSLVGSVRAVPCVRPGLAGAIWMARSSCRTGPQRREVERELPLVANGRLGCWPRWPAV